jgi:hypothetical protein
MAGLSFWEPDTTRRDPLRFPQATVSDIYTAELEAALSGERIYNPSYALWRDPYLWEKMRRDPDFEALIQMRKRAFAATQINVQPESNVSPDDKTLASIVDQALNKITNLSQAKYGLAEAVFRGASWAAVDGKIVPWAPTMQDGERGQVWDWWLPTKIRLIEPTRFELRKVDGAFVWHCYSVERRTWEPVQPDAPVIRHAYEDVETALGYGRGMIEALWLAFFSLQVLRREGLQGVERWAQGLLIAKVDSLRQGSRTNVALARDVLRMLERTRSRHVQVWDSQDTVETVAGPSDGWQMVMAFKSDLIQSVSRLMLGAVLPFGLAEDTGSLARAEVEQEQSDRYLQFDYDLMAADLSPIVKMFIKRNRPNLEALGLMDAGTPLLTLATTQRHDPLKQIGIVAEAMNAGLRLREDEVYERIGFTPPLGDDKVLGEDTVEAAGEEL